MILSVLLVLPQFLHADPGSETDGRMGDSSAQNGFSRLAAWSQLPEEWQERFNYRSVPSGEDLQERVFSNLLEFFNEVYDADSGEPHAEVGDEPGAEEGENTLISGLQFTAALLNRLERVEERSARFIISARQREFALKVMEFRLHQYLLMNNLQEAALLSDELTQFFPDRGFLLQAAEIYMALGNPSQARKRLQTYLQQASPGGEDYDRSSYLLSRVLIDEGSTPRALDLLYRSYAERLLEATGLGTWNRYSIQNLLILRNLLRLADNDETLSEEQREVYAELTFLLEEFAGRNPERAVPEPGLEYFPGPRVLSTAEDQVPRYIRGYIGEPQEPQEIQEQYKLQETREAPEGNSPSGSTPAASLSTETADSDMALIQLGVFSNRENAAGFQKRLQQREYPVFLSFDADRELYRVLLDSRDEQLIGSDNYANPRRLLLQLKEEGIEGFVVDE